MSGYLIKINTKVPYLDKVVDIDVNGRTLIFTGGNGCGKTQLMSFLFNEIKESVVDRKNYNVFDLEAQLSSNEDRLKNISPVDSLYTYYQDQVIDLKEKIKSAKNPAIKLQNLENFILSCHNFESVLIEFKAMRKSEVLKPTAVKSLDNLRKSDRENSRNSSSSMFEEFLVTNIANQAFSESKSINNDPKEAKRIASWFNKLENDLRNLFEDDGLELKFKNETLSFEIHQQNKDPYTFQSLSSGFSSIMAVYADLITKVSLRAVEPSELTGIVFIDEIDAHLHVSLQKKILAFLKKAFPKLQFIVSTHSPFVVSSVDDAVIYDLSKLEQVENLAMYSYQAVLEGLFGVLPVSNPLQEKIEKLAELLKSNPINIEEITGLLSQLPSNEDSLDFESLYFVKSAKIAVSKAKRK